MHVKDGEEAMIFKNDKGYYSIGLSRKDRNGEYYHAYFPCQFKKDVNVENKTKIKIKNAFMSFYNKDDKQVFYLMILDFQEIENKNVYELKSEAESNLPF